MRDTYVKPFLPNSLKIVDVDRIASWDAIVFRCEENLRRNIAPGRGQWSNDEPGQERVRFIAGKKKNLYDILGVSKSASKDEIKSKYREMAKKCHPDLNRDDKNAEGKFKEIASAYEVLENDSRRQIYDRMETLGIDYEVREPS